MSNPVRLHAPPTGARRVDAPSQEALDRCVTRALARGREEAVGEAADTLRRDAASALDRAAEALEAERAALLPRAAADAAWLATEIAREILRVELDAGRYDLERIVRDVLAASGAGRAPCTVHLHPDDVRALEGVRFRAGTTLEEDVEVSRGDVHVTTPRGLMVREVDDLLEAIREALLSREPA